jgi:glycosyltransferase involved in cell wall biosynthesis
VYNEERTLPEIMKAIAEACPDAEVLYVNDGSKDKSLELLHKHARPQDQVLTKPNGGKGSAVRLGLEKASSTYAVIQDADLEYDPKEIALLVTEAKAHPGTAVFGSRFLQKNPTIYTIFLLGNKTLTMVLNILFFARLTDSYTCYKLLPTELFRGLNLTSNGFELEAEIAAKCLKRGIPVREIPISYKPRTIAEGKKINWRDAWKGVVMMLKIRVGIR